MTLNPERMEQRVPRSHTQQERYDLEVAHLNAVIQHSTELRGVLNEMLGRTVEHGNRILQVPPPARTHFVVNAITGLLTLINQSLPNLEQHYVDLKAKR